MPMSNATLIRQYNKYRVSAAEALELLRKKALADGQYYYIGINKFDGWVEIFKATKPIDDYKLTAEEIDSLLAEKGLYLYATKGGWITIRRVPQDADNVSLLREPTEG